MNPQKVQLIDAGTGNLQSVYNALNNLNAEIRLVASGLECRKDEKTILPGVGAFRRFMEGLVERDLMEGILEIAQDGTPLLGICVGMQAMLDSSEEMGDTPGLGLIPGVVKRFPEKKGYTIPHTGWNDITFSGSPALLKDITPGSYFYFNHSYFCQPSNPVNSLARTEYILEFSSAVICGNCCGVQFHPEKSQNLGRQLIANFLSM
ncbi:MAG: imidazole glycerol phosphate synthase subunit HisH [Leptolinea sp.]|jgi:glutamine amidotransferase|nr:imidazole glycerol phosphate synthase subunit HisH [Leptolinea sp.]